MEKGKEIVYSHFGKPADVWKHLALCKVMSNEQPQIYVETNSASSDYDLSHTPEQQYGIYHFIDNAIGDVELSGSNYFDLENQAISNGKYLGSPALAMHILGNTVDKFVFFDIQETPLANIKEYANRYNLTDKVETVNQDSIIGILDRLPELPKSTLIHIDPYSIDTPSVNGCDYLDVFAKASEKGMKCFLWYGFNTLDEKKKVNDFILNKLSGKTIENPSCVELTMKIIQKDTIPCNPGILGSGLLTANLSKESVSAIVGYSKSLVDLYKNTNYNGFRGDLYQEEISIKQKNHVQKPPLKRVYKFRM